MRIRVPLMLAALMVIALPPVAFGLPSMPATAFTSAAGCGCHAALFEQWSGTMHAQALSDPLYRLKLKEGDAATNGAVTPFCLRCHSPIGVMSGDAAALSQIDASGVVSEGVVCAFCHRVTGTESPIGNASQTLNAEDVRFAQLKDPAAPHAAAYSPFHETAEFCGSCHNVSHPTNGTHLEATYTEWLESPYAAEGIVCQDCHMTPGPGVTKPNPGKAAAGAAERPHIFTMTFTGANAALGDAAAAEENLKAAATLDLDVPEILASGDVPVKTTITNVGAGHYLPTGLTEVRQMWLEVTATDSAGNEVLAERRDFGTVLKAADGSFPAEMWDAVGIQSDDRIPPRESVTNDYAFAMTSDAVTVSATLYYRSAPEDFAREAGVEVPTITMASVTKVVYPSAAAKDAASETVDEPAAGSEGAGTSWLPAVAAVVGVLVVGTIFVLLRRKK